MRDGRTRKLEVVERDESFDAFLSKWRAIVVILSGEAAGTEFELSQPNVSIGRGGEAHWAFDDDAMSKEHAALEFANGGIRLRDLGSMNGTRLNDSEVKAADLKNGDRFQLGQHVFQFVLEKRPKQPKTYVIPDA
jgi:pSer/pThr/pTyr-binding forkhead associated (FHA) protein